MLVTAKSHDLSQRILTGKCSRVSIKFFNDDTYLSMVLGISPMKVLQAEAI